MMSTSSSSRYPCRRAICTSSFACATTAPRCGVPTTVIPRPRRNSSSPSSRRRRSARSTVFVLTPSTAARSRAGGRRSPGFASPSAIARRISPATCSWSSVRSWRSTLTPIMMLAIVASSHASDAVTVTAPPRRPREAAPADLEALEALIEEARRRARRRRQRNGVAALIAGVTAAGAFYGFGQGGDPGDGRGGSAAEPPHVGWSAERAAEALRNGRLTILGEYGIQTVSSAGRVRTLIQCDNLSQKEEPCAAHPWSVDWAPDGRRLAYATAVGPGAMPGRWRFVALHVHDTVSGAHVRRRLSCFASDIDWSPDGSRLAYVCQGRLYLIRADLAGPPRLLR